MAVYEVVLSARLYDYIEDTSAERAEDRARDRFELNFPGFELDYVADVIKVED